MLLDCPPGSGMNLSIDGRAVDLVEREFIDFPGEAVTHGVLRGTPVRDFNVMARRGAIKYRRGWKSVAALEWFRLGGSDWRVVHVHSGVAELVGAASLRDVAAGETVVVSGEDELNLRGSKAGARLVWAVFTAAA